MKKSIGQFIAALRKANGMTQQDIADRLNVSNKAVSRWERDECAPDISVIPALAELLGVSCDELLKGERILDAEPERREPRVERQVKTLLNRTLSDFKMMIWVALAAAAVGLILMFGIAYGFYRPVIAFTVMLIFEAGALVLTILAVTRTLDIKRCNDIFDMADDAQLLRFDRVLGNLSFWALYSVFATVMLSLPFVLFRENGIPIESVITIESYFTVCFGGIVLMLSMGYLICKKPYISWITTGRLPKRDRITDFLNFVQIGLIVIAGIAFVIAPYFGTVYNNEISLGLMASVGIGIISMAASAIFFLIFIANRKDRKPYILDGIRNICLIPSTMILTRLHTVYWMREAPYIDDHPAGYIKYDNWSFEYIWYAALYCMIVFLIFAVIKRIINSSKNKEAVEG